MAHVGLESQLEGIRSVRGYLGVSGIYGDTASGEVQVSSES